MLLSILYEALIKVALAVPDYTLACGLPLDEIPFVICTIYVAYFADSVFLPVLKLTIIDCAIS